MVDKIVEVITITKDCDDCSLFGGSYCFQGRNLAPGVNRPGDKCPGPGKYLNTIEKIPEGAIPFTEHGTAPESEHDLHGSMWIEKDDPPTPENPCKLLLFFDDDSMCVTFIANFGQSYKIPSSLFYEKFEKVGGQ